MKKITIFLITVITLLIGCKQEEKQYLNNTTPTITQSPESEKPSDEEIKSLVFKYYVSEWNPNCSNKLQWLNFSILNSGETELSGRKGIEIIFNGQVEFSEDCNYQTGLGYYYHKKGELALDYKNKKIFVYKLNNGWELMK